MSIGSRLKYFRTLKGITQKQLGVAIGIAESTAEARVGQYETEYRTPKDDYITNLANILEVSPHAITAPNLDSYTGMAHTFFMLEDMFGISIKSANEKKVNFVLNKTLANDNNLINDFFIQWYEMKNEVKTGKMTKQKYDQWRYNYEIAQNKQNPMKEIIPQEFSQRLKKLRIENELSQEDIALKFNISQQTYSKYERSKSMPPIKTLLEIANYFGVSLDYLVGNELHLERN